MEHLKCAVKYDVPTRRRVRNRIAALVKSGHTFDQVAETLNAEGIKTPSGGEIYPKFVANQFYRINQQRSRKIWAVRPRTPKTEKKHVTKSTDLVTMILNHPSLDQDKKLAIMKILIS